MDRRLTCTRRGAGGGVEVVGVGQLRDGPCQGNIQHHQPLQQHSVKSGKDGAMLVGNKVRVDRKSIHLQ